MTHRPLTRDHVIVAGGGIGGLAAALSLRKAGVRVTLLEQADEFGEVGAGIQIAPNGTRVLRRLGLLDRTVELGLVPNRIVMRDALDDRELTSLDLRDVARRYGAPYVVVHRSDLHGLLLEACRDLDVELHTGSRVVAYHRDARSAAVELADGRSLTADAVIAADGLHSVARAALVGDDVVSSGYVAYRGTAAADEHPVVGGHRPDEVTVHVGPRCHFVQYGLRGGALLNQVAVFESPTARAGGADWGTPDELDQAFAATCAAVRDRLPLLGRDRWWRMFDREPVDRWVRGRLALLGDSAHPPLQYLAQGAIMAIEDGWSLGRQVAAAGGPDGVDWDAALGAYEAERAPHCRRVVLTARAWGELWHLDGPDRDARNDVLEARAVDDYTHVDWLFDPVAGGAPERGTPAEADAVRS
jgi:2-polyprenyl-6-methoxyphenol hydroxylase-like FAD-dependent oxidoreductase